MFNPNGLFKWSVELASNIYANPKAEATWDFIYPNICRYMEDRGKRFKIKENGDRIIISVENKDISVITENDTISIAYYITTPLCKEILDEAYGKKMIFGLPVLGIITMEDFFPKAVTITFMSRQIWKTLEMFEVK